MRRHRGWIRTVSSLRVIERHQSSWPQESLSDRSDCQSSGIHESEHSSHSTLAGPSALSCANCSKQGHQAPQCLEPAACFRCKQTGHMSFDCPQRSTQSSQQYDPPTCRFCLGKKHPDPYHPRSECPRAPACFQCGQTDHEARDCSQPMSCTRCHQNGHAAHACSEALLCNNCLKPGHQAAQCGGPPACFRCKQQGHMSFECPESFQPSHPLPRPRCRWCTWQKLADNHHSRTECPRAPPCSKCNQLGHEPKECSAQAQPCCAHCRQRGHTTYGCPALPRDETNTGAKTEGSKSRLTSLPTSQDHAKPQPEQPRTIVSEVDKTLGSSASERELLHGVRLALPYSHCLLL